MIDPDAVAAVVPRIALSARGATDLAGKFDATTNFRRAIIAPAVVRSTIDCFPLTLAFLSIMPSFRPFGTRGKSGCEIRATTTVGPNCMIIEVPRGASCARRATALANQVDAVASVDLTVMALAIIRRAVDAVVYIKGNGGQNEIGSAAVVDPNPLTV